MWYGIVIADKKEYLKNRFKRDFLQYSMLQEVSLPAKEIHLAIDKNMTTYNKRCFGL